MPLYYFDVREGTRFVVDEDGSEFSSVEEAEVEAAEVAAMLGRDRLPRANGRKSTVEVQNEQRQMILTATVSLEIVRVDPTPQKHGNAN